MTEPPRVYLVLWPDGCVGAVYAKEADARAHAEAVQLKVESWPVLDPALAREPEPQ